MTQQEIQGHMFPLNTFLENQGFTGDMALKRFLLPA